MSSPLPVEPLVAVPDRGRLFSDAREVRLGDTDRRGRLRLDALARYLQDVANDDAREAIGEDAAAWVVRRTVADVLAWPRIGEVVTLTTFLGGVGARWAERRTSVRGADGGHVETASLWVHLDLRTGLPSPLPPSFVPIYGEVYGERKVSGRLTIPAPPVDVPGEAWPVRAADFDVMGHVNNAAYWAFVEDVIAERAPRPPVRIELEYKNAIEPGDAVSCVRAADAGLAWLVGSSAGDDGDGGKVHAAARISALTPS